MKTVYLFISVLLIGFSAAAQDHFTVSYQTEYFTYAGYDSTGKLYLDWVSNPDFPVYKLSYNNSRSYFRKIAAPAATLVHGKSCDYCNPAYYRDHDGAVYYDVAPITDKRLMVKDSAQRKWYFTTVTDTILGLPCRLATTISGQNYINAWYSWELPAGYGPFNYSGLPGTVMLLETPAARYRAIEITENKEDIDIPQTATIDPVTYETLAREKRMYRAGIFGKRVDPYEVPRLPTIRISRF